jgi:hypothetical protein
MREILSKFDEDKEIEIKATLYGKGANYFEIINIYKVEEHYCIEAE